MEYNLYGGSFKPSLEMSPLRLEKKMKQDYLQKDKAQSARVDQPKLLNNAYEINDCDL